VTISSTLSGGSSSLLLDLVPCLLLFRSSLAASEVIGETACILQAWKEDFVIKSMEGASAGVRVLTPAG